jgi:hypothetical protein
MYKMYVRSQNIVGKPNNWSRVEQEIQKAQTGEPNSTNDNYGWRRQESQTRPMTTMAEGDRRAKLDQWPLYGWGRQESQTRPMTTMAEGDRRAKLDQWQLWLRETGEPNSTNDNYGWGRQESHTRPMTAMAEGD